MQSTFSVSPEAYYGRAPVIFIPYEHFSKASDSSLTKGQKAVHIFIGVVQCIPILGQLGAMGEKKIVVSKIRKEEEKIVRLVEVLYKDASEEKLFPLDSKDRRYLNMQPEFKQLRDQIKRTSSPLYTEQIVRKIKELASCPELIEARAALEVGIKPESLSDGISGSYILRGRRGQSLGIFKPSEQEPGMVGNMKGYVCGNKGLFEIYPGTGYLRERVAYLLDKKTGFSGVPLTKITQFDKRYFPHTPSWGGSGVLVGSFQKWAEGTHQACEDYQVLPSLISSGNGHKIPVAEIHKIAIFDIRTLNCDRHLKNFLVTEDQQTVYPIDHGFICPGNAKSLRFDWIAFSQAKKPFSKETLDYIDQLDPKADRELIKRKLPGVSSETLAMLYISGSLLKIAAKKGLTAYQIGDLWMRRKHDEWLVKMVNMFKPVPSKIPSYFETEIWEKIKHSRSLNVNDFLTREVDLYLSANH